MCLSHHHGEYPWPLCRAGPLNRLCLLVPADDGHGSHGREVCRRHELYVSFRDLGWLVISAFPLPATCRPWCLQGGGGATVPLMYIKAMKMKAVCLLSPVSHQHSNRETEAGWAGPLGSSCSSCYRRHRGSCGGDSRGGKGRRAELGEGEVRVTEGMRVHSLRSSRDRCYADGLWKKTLMVPPFPTHRTGSSPLRATLPITVRGSVLFHWTPV